MLLSKANLLIKDIIDRKPQYEVLDAVHLDEDGSTVASNGRALLATSPVEPNTDFPPVEGLNKTKIPKIGVNLPKHLVSKTIQNLPKGSTPFAAITQNSFDRVELTTVDTQQERRVASFPSSGRFPNWKDTFKRAYREKRTRICVNRKDLIKILETMDKAAPDKGEENPVYLEISGPEDGIIIRTENYDTGQHLVGLVMPLKTEGLWLRQSTWEKNIFENLARKPKVSRKPGENEDYGKVFRF